MRFRVILTCWLTGLSLVAFASQADQVSQSTLRRLLPADTLIEFIDESQGHYPMLTQPAVRAEPLGGIIILTDTQSQQQWLDQSHSLRTHLAEHGWITLTLPLPRQPKRIDGETDEAFDQRQETHASQVMNRIGTALTQLDQQRLLVIAMGRSAEWAAQSILGKDPSIRLIMINPRPIDDQQPLRFIDALMSLESTLIDLYKEPYPSDQIANPDARMRRHAMIRAAHPDYHQQLLKDNLWGRESDWFKRQVRGVINSYILMADQRQEATAQPDMAVDERPPGIRR